MATALHSPRLRHRRIHRYSGARRDRRRIVFMLIVGGLVIATLFALIAAR